MKIKVVKRSEPEIFINEGIAVSEIDWERISYSIEKSIHIAELATRFHNAQEYDLGQEGFDSLVELLEAVREQTLTERFGFETIDFIKKFKEECEAVHKEQIKNIGTSDKGTVSGKDWNQKIMPLYRIACIMLVRIGIE